MEDVTVKTVHRAVCRHGNTNTLKMESVRDGHRIYHEGDRGNLQACLRDLAFSILHQQRTIQEGK